MSNIVTLNPKKTIKGNIYLTVGICSDNTASVEIEFDGDCFKSQDHGRAVLFVALSGLLNGPDGLGIQHAKKKGLLPTISTYLRKTADYLDTL